jgi:adenylate cyclase
MNAPPNIDPVTAHSDVVRWLTNDTRDERFIDNIFGELCVRLQRAGIPVKRASLHIMIQPSAVAWCPNDVVGWDT